MKTLTVNMKKLADMIMASMHNGGDVCVDIDGDLDVRVNGESMADWEIIYTQEAIEHCRAESDDSISDEGVAYWIISEYGNPEITVWSTVDGEPVEVDCTVVAA